ncbi:uncharacterized protein LOC111296036 [Durio zibethinus]|uniref:Uncharacterized protein LOC111296036 n=1 Tax=Durio zibethinus TaxID=66656 RepID=A0A6P5YZ22_DURZI|nr:uncharacterized protein LOC111296036 [Durio zibethinus]XP_022745783.1 uncharacterized protein LOC111296036 [Durio zibethinus]
MQSRRNEEHVELSPTVKLRSQHRTAAEVGTHDPYPVSRCEVMNDRSPPPRGRRSCSPKTLDVSRRGASVRDRMSGSMEGKDSYGWHLGGGSTEKARSRSPAYEQMRKRPHFDDEGFVNRKYDYVAHVGFGDNTNSTVRGSYRYDHGSSRMCKEKDYMKNRVTSVDEHMMGQKLIPVEDFAKRVPRRLPQDVGPSLNYAETSGQLLLSSGGIEHRETLPSNKGKVMNSYKEDKPMFHSQDAAYGMVAASHSRDLLSTPQLKDFAGTSSSIPRTELLSSYQDDAPLPVSDEYLRSNRKLTETVGYNKYNRRPLTDSVGDPEAAKRNMSLYQQWTNSPSRAEYEEYLYRKPRAIGSNNHGYLDEDLTRMMPSQSQVSYEDASIDYGHRDMSKPKILHHVVERIDNTNDSYGNSRKGIIWDDHTLQPNYIDMRRSYASMQGGEYLGSEHTYVESGRRLPQDYEISHLDASHNRQLSNLRSDYGFGRGVGLEFQNERLINSDASEFDSEQCRLGLRTKRMEEEPDMFSERILKRKYLMEEDVGRPSSKTIVSSKLHSAGDFGGPYESEEQIDEDRIALHASRTKGYGHNEYRKVGRTYDGQNHHGDLELDDWCTSQGSLAHSQRVPVRFYKNSGKYIKGNPRTGSFNWHTSHNNDRRSNLHKQNKVWKRNEDYDEDINANEGDMTEDLVNYAEVELSEDSEEFKQLVHEAFLKYSKRLNLNQSVRRRYKEQGQAGSLFCIVCGRSYSKEFMDTQRLVRHAFMSHKVGLRAQHLGLHKAICVLLGWDSVAPPDTITWVPHVLPQAQAFAQKEDLVLWPPIVVIHNISMANNNPQEQKVLPIEGVQAFLRGKGVVGGKITVCLGRPADQSIMVVKFLSNFTGLAMAERLHKYFVENKRGRVEFHRTTSNNGKSSIEEMGIQGDKLEEQLLYGYMAIAEELDKLDFHNRKWSLVKSKKEIQDLANDPVKIEER